MKPFLFAPLAGLLLAAFSPGQPALAADRAADLLAPLNPQAAVPPLVYRPVLPPARALDEPSAGDWPALNEQVRRVGGWRAYARQGLPPAATVAPPAAASAAASAGARP
ncbi:hypothetical protein [Kinneretia aquatilis]|uniref:hypothetical protein n=1 Tax=Kinneretia aquatilis TaxID=2070761 RepID=UPI0014951042|nr:hypothetical protein [Paucibacter aquatile]WIV97220.1 hypothetical protein K9V56_019720 [Paucibacter aquatile]